MDLADDDRGAWDIPSLYAVVAYVAGATFAIAAPTLYFAGVGNGAVGARLAIACWVVLHATWFGVAFWKTRSRPRLLLHCAIVALGIWAAGLFALQFLQDNAILFLLFVVSTEFEFAFDTPEQVGEFSNYIPFFDSPFVEELGWGMFVVVSVVAAVLDVVLLLITIPLWLTVWTITAPAKRRGRCDSCGYDIRASIQFGRCPECGRSMDIVIHASAQK